MKSLWNKEIATQLSEDLLAMRVYSSRLLGGEPALVLHGGGNTSVKATIPDFFGDPQEIIYVKGSGWDLGAIEAPGFAPVRMSTPLRLVERQYLSDSDMVKSLRAALLEPNAPTPSVETILHAIIPLRFVDHTHADALVTLTNTPNGAERIRELYGPNLLIIPYVMPGFVLARKVYQMTRGIDWSKLSGMVLMNHGLFTFAHEAQQSYEQHLALVTQAEEYIARHAKVTTIAAPSSTVNLVELARLRHAVSMARGEATLAHLDNSPTLLAFANLPNVADITTRGLLTPDHVLRTKRIPVVIEHNVEVDVARYADDYRAYFARNQNVYPHRQLTMLDPAPRWAVWPGNGTVVFGRTVGESAVLNDIKAHTIPAIQHAEALGGWQPLNERQIFEVEYWELEQAKASRKTSRAATLQGKVAVVTGGASGIGRACVEALAAQGAVVVAFDINPAVATLFKQSSILGLVCDVTDSTGLKAAVETTVRRFGGLDLVVCNAGMFPSSQSIDEIDPAAWSRSLELNLTSQQRLIQYSIPYLKLGIDPSIVIIGSKNVPAPGPGAGAYSVAKAGLTQLARVAALELGKFGIRVNVLHPNMVFDTGLWTPELLAKRAANYGISVEEYKTNNLLHVEITSKDVAALVCAMASPLFAKTTGAQVPIDGGNDRVI
jgi:rhamnose utilization protein RhaD (predicted bifunctional aldolase and dehydrogenase)/NAD(P)-dependent dehydrogenase (short-subunit alcohol dehydrogenase family)